MYRELFSRYQKQLILFANTEHGKAFVADRWGSRIERNDRIVRITPDSLHVLKDFIRDKPIIQATFFPRSPYLKKFAETLTYLSIMEDYQDIRKLDGRKIAELGRYIFLDTLTVYPDANPETTSVDGRVWVGAQDAVWGTVRGTAGNNSADTDASQFFVYADATTTSNQFATIGRGIFLFDTSSLTASANISAATFSLYGTAKSNGLSFTDAHASVALVSSSPASNIALVNADFNIANFGSTRFATDFSYASFSIVGYNDMALNASGITNISKTGVSKFGTMFTCDLDNTAPNWISGLSTSINCNYADNGSNKPKLVVTYTLGGAKSFSVIIA